MFLSYAHADQARVAKLAEALSAAGLKVWWDTALETGSRFSKDIERELNAADAVLVVWSAASVASAWVLDEAGHGRDSGRLVPVRIDDVTPPLGFRQYQATDLSAWKGRAGDPKFQAVVAAIQRLAGSTAPAIPARAPAKPSGPSRRALFGGVAGVAVLAAGGFAAWTFLGPKPDDGTASVAVLPFANLSGDPAQAFFSDGVAEELRNALSQIRGLTVIGRVSSEQFRDAKDMSEVAAKLGVDHVLTGSVRRSPTTIRIGAQLVDGKTGAETWSQSFDEPVGDALVVQSKIASNVLTALSQRLGTAVGSVAVGGTSNPAAQELFLKAQALQNATGNSEANARSSLALLDAAIALDARYAEAHAVRSRVLADFANGAFGPGAARLGYQQPDAMAAARRAVALAPASGLARISLAARYQDESDLRHAVAEGEAALRLAPGDSRVLGVYSSIVRSFDSDRAVDIARRALTLDPLNIGLARNLARNQVYAGRYAEAAATIRQAMAMSNNKTVTDPLVEALLRLGRYDEARQAVKDVDTEWYRLTFAAILEARAGNRAAADAALAGVRAIDDGTMHYQFAQIYTARGETAKALDEIEAALRTNDPGLTDVAVDPAFDSIRKEPRFKAVQDKIIPPDLFVPPKRE